MLRFTQRTIGRSLTAPSFLRDRLRMGAVLSGVSCVLGVVSGCSSPVSSTRAHSSGGTAAVGTGGSTANASVGGSSSGSGMGGKGAVASGGSGSSSASGGAGNPVTGAGGGSSMVVNPGWWDAAWTKRRIITVNGTQAEALTNFPAPIKLDSTFDFASAKSQGEDVRITDNQGTLLDSEIESWSATDAVIWVRVPNLPPTGTSVELRMYYGNPAAAALPASAAKGVWSADSYLGVWHLADNRDSGANGYDGIATDKKGEPATRGTFVPGKMGSGFQVHSSAQEKFFATEGSTILAGASVVTFSGWVKLDPAPMNVDLERPPLISISGDVSPPNATYHNGHAAFEVSMADLSIYTILAPIFPLSGNPFEGEFPSGTTLERESWVHVAVVMDALGHTTNIYKNGAFTESKSDYTYGATMFAPGAEFDTIVFGANCSLTGNNFADQTMDEYRLQKVSRSAAWIKEEYDSMTSPTFAAVGQVETK